MNDSTSNNNQTEISGAHTDKKVQETKEGFKMPTLDQFMELVTGEDSTVMATTSAYNVYNKYNKSS